jgi:hypothetical protein
MVVTERLFTPAEVDALIPELAEMVRELRERHGQARALAQALEEQKRHIQVSGGSLVDRREWKARAERLDGLTIEVRGGLQRIQGLGGTVKDLEMGLVDFPGFVPGTRSREPVNLCWKYGETAVRFWHGFDEGYAHRKPLP